ACLTPRSWSMRPASTSCTDGTCPRVGSGASSPAVPPEFPLVEIEPRSGTRLGGRRPSRIRREDDPPKSARACALAGWEYRLLGEADALVTANLRWSAGYRHPRHHLAETVDVLRRVFATPRPLMAGAAAAGDPIAVVPVLFHLLW